MIHSPVLFLVFNRPDTTRRVFEAIRAARPPRLYVAADGPRVSRADEAQRCAQVREIATSVDWPCEVKTLFRADNLGCRRAVSSAIDWFFEEEPEGIVLEDDVLPLPGFFAYCDELLARHREDPRVVAISGSNLISNRFVPHHSYFFSRHNHIWGWASWRRAWCHYDVAMRDWPHWRNEGGLARVANGDRHFQDYWQAIFDATYRGEIDTWDYQWTFACWRMGGVAVLPAFNQTSNLGFGADATHTTAEVPDCVRESQPRPLIFPLRHPDQVASIPEADRMIDRRVFGIGPVRTLKRRLRSLPWIGGMAKGLWNLMGAALRRVRMR